jgi:hypothetical protein
MGFIQGHTNAHRLKNLLSNGKMGFRGVGAATNSVVVLLKVSAGQTVLGGR